MNQLNKARHMTTTSQNFRLYTFTHVYMSAIQHGIQSGHLAAQMTANSIDTLDEANMLAWASVDKTMIVLRGGNSASLAAIAIELSRLASALDLPTDVFREDEQSMEGMLTVVGILVPMDIWQLDISAIRAFAREGIDLSSAQQLALFLSNFSLA